MPHGQPCCAQRLQHGHGALRQVVQPQCPAAIRLRHGVNARQGPQPGRFRFAIDVEGQLLRHRQRAVQLGQRALGHDAAVVDDDHAVGQALDLFHAVRGVDERLARRLQRQQGVEDGIAACWVDAGRRLVERQHVGVVHQRARDVQPALHAAAEGGRFVACAVGQPDGGQHLGGAAPGLGWGQAVEGAEQLDIRLRRQVFEQCNVLRHETDAALAGGFVPRQHRAAHQHAAGVGWGQAADHGDGGRLAGAIRPAWPTSDPR